MNIINNLWYEVSSIWIMRYMNANGVVVNTTYNYWALAVLIVIAFFWILIFAAFIWLVIYAIKTRNYMILTGMVLGTSGLGLLPILGIGLVMGLFKDDLDKKRMARGY